MAVAIKRTVGDVLTDTFIERTIALMADGNNLAPWRRTWDQSLGMPRNITSGCAYRGSNTFMTMMAGYSSPFWITALQMKAKGGIMRKGEKGTPISRWIFPKPIEQRKAKDKDHPFCMYYTVWNVEQCDGLEELVAKELGKMGPLEAVNPIEQAQAIVDDYANGPVISHGGGRACYSPSQDRVLMPVMDAFHSAEEYYHTLYHELGHSSGNRTRLARYGIVNHGAFADHAYSEEELIAEMTAGMLAGFAGIGSPEQEANSASYLLHWLKKLKQNPTWLEASGREAQKAADRIRGVKWEQAFEPKDKEKEKAAA